MPDLLVALVKRLVRWGVLPARMAPDSAIINMYDKVGCPADLAPLASDYRHHCPRQVVRLPSLPVFMRSLPWRRLYCCRRSLLLQHVAQIWHAFVLRL